MTLTYIALGSNLQTPLIQINDALAALARIPHSQLQAVSAFYRTPPLGSQPQPDYLNAAAALHTHLDAFTLLDHLQQIESQQGRVRSGQRWQPRTLDLDIMLFGDQTITSEQLTIPHYAMCGRAFMLLPLLEIAPTLHLPDGRSLSALLATLDCSAICLWQTEQGVAHADY